MAVVLIATWTAAEGSEEEVLDALAQLAPLSRTEPGCRYYQPYRDPDEPRVIHIFEVYDDEDALAAHAASPHFAEHALGRAIPLLESRERRLFETLDI